MAGKAKWFIAGFLTKSMLSGNKKEMPQEVKEQKQKEYENFFASHPFVAFLAFAFAFGACAWYLIAVLKG